jgi:hypothetical protein
LNKRTTNAHAVMTRLKDRIIDEHNHVTTDFHRVQFMTVYATVESLRNTGKDLIASRKFVDKILVTQATE